MPFAIDRTIGHIDRFVDIMFRSKIDDLEPNQIVKSDELFGKLCRVISLTERRGYQQVKILLRHPLVLTDRGLIKIFGIIEEDEPSHWAPYDGWLDAHNQRNDTWWERMIDRYVHSELLMLKIPVLFIAPWLRRRTTWADEHDADHIRSSALAAKG
jgi:hypothetical protein